MSKKTSDVKKVDNRITARLKDPLAIRFERIVEASKRSKTSILEECLDIALPKLEKEHSLKQAA